MSMKQLIGYDLDDFLRLAKLQRRVRAIETILPAVGFAVFGAALGMGVGLMVAPSSGTRLRKGMGDRLEKMGDRLEKLAERIGEKKREMVNATMRG